MKTIRQKEICLNCKEKKYVNEFYGKGIRFLNCLKCREARVRRKKSFEIFLKNNEMYKSEDV